MDKYDDLFEETAPNQNIFTDKRALDPLATSTEISARDDQERELATILNSVHEGYLPPTVSIYGPPGTGKTLTTRRVCEAFVSRHDGIAVEYVNLKECQTLFSGANEILYELTGEKKGAYEGLDGVFEGIWEALAAYPEWTVLILDEIDHLRQDSNYESSDFFYRLLRGEGKLKRDISMSVWLVSNQLLSVDLRLDSRVKSAMSNESVLFPPYNKHDLAAILMPRVAEAFRSGAFPDSVFKHGVTEAARRWGDARKALRLFRQAGEVASKAGLETVTRECIDQSFETTERITTMGTLLQLPENQFMVLLGVASRIRDGEIIQPVTTSMISTYLGQEKVPDEFALGERAIRAVLSDLEMMGLVETWVEFGSMQGAKQIETTFKPEWIHACKTLYASRSTYLTPETDL